MGRMSRMILDDKTLWGSTEHRARCLRTRALMNFRILVCADVQSEGPTIPGWNGWSLSVTLLIEDIPSDQDSMHMMCERPC